MDKITQQKLDTWLEEKSEKPKLVLIYGPTACGKTALSLDVAGYLGSEIISVDARQIYRGLDIGTGKIRGDEMRGIPHHMIDIADPTEVFSVVDYRNRVRELDIFLPLVGFESATSTRRVIPKEGARGGTPPNFPYKGRNQIPVLAGGTGLYIDSLIYERSYPTTEPDWALRDELETYREKNGNQALWQMLHDIDPEYADMLHPNNYRYVMRGIEVWRETGRSKLAAQDGLTLLYDVLFLTPYDGDRASLYARIDARVAEMFATGLIAEVGYNVDLLYHGDLVRASSCPGLATIGYREVVAYLQGVMSLDECIALVQQHNRNYAKRQITWNKKYDSNYN